MKGCHATKRGFFLAAGMKRICYDFNGFESCCDAEAVSFLPDIFMRVSLEAERR